MQPGGRDTTGKRRRVTAAHREAQQLDGDSPSLLCSSLGGSGEADCLLPRRSPQAQSCLSPSLTLLSSCGREEGRWGRRRKKKVAGEREGDRERERDHTAKVQGPLAGSTPREATLTVGGHRCDTAAPQWRRAGSQLRCPAASEPHCLSQSLWDQKIPTRLALQTHGAHVVVIGDPLITRGGSKGRSTLRDTYALKPWSKETPTLQRSHSALCNSSLRDKVSSERSCSAQDTLAAVMSQFHMHKRERQQGKASLTASGTPEDTRGLQGRMDMAAAQESYLSSPSCPIPV